MQGFWSQLQTEVKRKYTHCFNGVLYVTANARYLICVRTCTSLQLWDNIIFYEIRINFNDLFQSKNILIWE